MCCYLLSPSQRWPNGQVCFSWALFQGYQGCLLNQCLGPLESGHVQTFFAWLWIPFSTLFWVLKALALASALGGAGAFFLAFNAILVKQADSFFY